MGVEYRSSPGRRLTSDEMKNGCRAARVKNVRTGCNYRYFRKIRVRGRGRLDTLTYLLLRYVRFVVCEVTGSIAG